MSKRDSEADFAELGRRDGEAAVRRAIAVLPRSDVPGRLGHAVERELAQLSHTAADALERGAPPDAVEAFKAGWWQGFERQLDEFTEAILPMLPPDDHDEEDNDD